MRAIASPPQPADAAALGTAAGRTEVKATTNAPADVQVTVIVTTLAPGGVSIPVAHCDVELLVTAPATATPEEHATPGEQLPPRWSPTERTNAQGRATFTVRRGEACSAQVHCALGGSSSSTALRAGIDNVVHVRIEPRLWLRGRVLDVDGRPVVGADVEFVPYATRVPQQPSLLRIARSDSDGRFATPLARGGQVGASHPKFAPAAPQNILLPQASARSGGTSNSAAAGQPAIKDVTLRLVGSGAWVQGTVVDGQGRTVTGAHIELRPSKSGRSGWLALPRFARSDAQGKFVSGPLRPGEIACVALAPGMGPTKVTFEALLDQRFELRLQMSAACRLAGTVMSPTGQPIANAVLSAHCQGTFEPRQIRSGDDGSFVFDELAPGKVECWAEHEGVRRSATLQVKADAPTTWNVVLGGARDGTPATSLLLVDRSGAPLVGWRVRLVWPGNRYLSGRTDELGHVDLRSLESAPAVVFVHAPGSPLSQFADARFDIGPAAHERVRLEVDTDARTSSLVGQVVSENLVEGAAEIALWHHEHREYASLTANADGSFRLPRVPAGTLDVEVRLAGHATLRRGGVCVRAGEDADLGTLTVRAAGAVRGTVVGPDGQAPKQLELKVVSKDALLVGTYSGGVYRVDNVPAGRHVLQVQGDGVAGVGFEIDVQAGVEIEHPIQLKAGVERRIQIDVPHEARGHLSLSLRRSGEPLGWLASQDIGAARTAEFLACMTPGDYDVKAWAVGGFQASGSVRFAPGDEAPVRFTLMRR